jgi:hypothetical protein
MEDLANRKSRKAIVSWILCVDMMDGIKATAFILVLEKSSNLRYCEAICCCLCASESFPSDSRFCVCWCVSFVPRYSRFLVFASESFPSDSRFVC